jgi:hypothetical protein
MANKKLNTAQMFDNVLRLLYDMSMEKDINAMKLFLSVCDPVEPEPKQQGGVIILPEVKIREHKEGEPWEEQ